MKFKNPDPELFEYYPRLARINDYVNENYYENISLDQAASVAAMEATYFSSYFRKKVGICFSDWLRQLRTRKAIELLKNTDHSITYIAFEVGFNDLRTFERTFKKYTQQTPTEFREAYRSKPEEQS